MTNTNTPEVPKAIGAKINAGPWLQQFAVTGTVECLSDECDGFTLAMSPGDNARDLWNAIEAHMFARHVGPIQIVWNDEAQTALPSEDFDRLKADLDEPPVPNEPTREAFRQLNETVTRRPERADCETL